METINVNNFNKKRFGWYYDKDRYSLKELVCNYFISFGWLLGIIVVLINIGINHAYVDSIIKKEITTIPWSWYRLYKMAFLLLISSAVAGVIKAIIISKRKKGQVLSINEARALINHQNSSKFAKPVQKTKAYWIVVSISIAIALAIVNVIIWI